jgi:cobalt-zinc-cadmium efflux system outer membrane protein
VDLRRAQIAERERRLRAEVRTKAGDFLAAQRTLATVGEVLAANRRALGVVRARVQSGAAPPLDESLQLLEVSRMEATEVAVRGRLDVVGLQLRAVAGLAAGPPVAIRGDLDVASLPDVEQATREAVLGRPDAIAVRAEAAMAGARVRKEEAEGRWDASVNVGYQRQDVGFDLMGLTASGATRPIQDVFHYFGAGVSITLPVRNRNEGNVTAARAELRAVERRQELVDRMIHLEIAAAVAQDAAARRALDLYRRGVRDVAARNLDIVRQAYELGRGTLLDVIAEQRRYLEIENGYTEALKQAYDAGVELARATGGR